MNRRIIMAQDGTIEEAIRATQRTISYKKSVMRLTNKALEHDEKLLAYLEWLAGDETDLGSKA